MRRSLLPIGALALTSILSSHTVLAADSPLTADEKQRIDELNDQIETMTKERDTLKKRVEEKKEPKLWKGDLDFGYVDTSGNSNETSIKSDADITREHEAWRYTINFNSLNTEADKVRSAEKYFLSNRLAYAYSEHNYWFGYASYEDDRFSGYQYQVTASGGYGRRLYNQDNLQWDAEIGPGYRYSKLDKGSDPSETREAIARLYTDLNWQFTDSASFEQSLSVETGKDNTITKSMTALKAKVIGAFSVKLSYTIKYTSDVPNDTEHADKETAVTVAYSF